MINRPGVAQDFLQTELFLIHKCFHTVPKNFNAIMPKFSLSNNAFSKLQNPDIY